MCLQIFQVGKLQRRNMRRLQHYRRGDAGLQRLLPALGAQTPTLARLHTWELVRLNRRAQIIANLPGKLEELSRRLECKLCGFPNRLFRCGNSRPDKNP